MTDKRFICARVLLLFHNIDITFIVFKYLTYQFWGRVRDRKSSDCNSDIKLLTAITS